VIWSLYFPIIISLGFFIAAVKARFGNKRLIEFERFGYKFIISNNFVGKFALASGALSFLPMYVVMDFTQFYPSELRMQVYFDQAGISESLAEMPQDSIRKLGVVFDWQAARNYYDSMDRSRRRVTGKNEPFFSSGAQLSSEGRTTFVIEKIGDLQTYRIVEAEGNLTHTLVRPSGNEERFVTLFSKVASAGDFVHPTFSDIFIYRSFVIFPRFSEKVADYNQANGVQVDHFLVGLTRVYIWPMPGYSNTVFLYEDPQGRYVPIAYAVYY
jgi:hypothetical protein